MRSVISRIVGLGTCLGLLMALPMTQASATTVQQTQLRFRVDRVTSPIFPFCNDEFCDPAPSVTVTFHYRCGPPNTVTSQFTFLLEQDGRVVAGTEPHASFENGCTGKWVASVLTLSGDSGLHSGSAVLRALPGYTRKVLIP
jgi:hypothetical protein